MDAHSLPPTQPSPPAPEPTPLVRYTRAFVFLAIALGACVGFYDIQGYYGDFRLPYGLGAVTIPPAELLFYLWYGFFGSVAALALLPLLQATPLPQRLLALAARLAQQPQRLVLYSAIAAFLLSLFARVVLFLDSPITDDESTYLFVAQTLLQGGVTLPSPGDAAFFNNQFVYATDHHWYGKYPIGHPLLLAIGEALGARILVVPLIAAASVVLTYQLGRRIFAPPIALLGTTLLLLSPQFVLTHATQLSQPTSGLFLLLGLWTALKLRDTQRLSWALASGLAWAMALLTRPFPGILFLPVIAAFALRLPFPKAQKIRAFAIALLPVLAAITALFVINKRQTGGWTKTSYQSQYKTHKDRQKATKRATKHTHVKRTQVQHHIAFSKRSVVASSWASAALRQLFWLLGSPLFLLFLCFAAFAPHRAYRYDNLLLLVGSIGAIYLYRILIPKTVVASTGPIYVAEATPLLSLLVAAGMIHLSTRAAAFLSPQTITAAALAIGLSVVALFVPFQAQQLQRSGLAWQRPLAKLQQLQRQKKRKLLVFSNALTHYKSHDTWAHYPPNPHPSLKDDILFVRRMTGPNGAKRNFQLWKKRFPSRLPVTMSYDAHGRLHLRILTKPPG